MTDFDGANEGRVIVITDCGSTTTKAILIEKTNGVYRQVCRGESPTTVEAPVEDVTVGVKRALKDLTAISGRQLIDEKNNIIRPARGKVGCDWYISTSSAGGGLQMAVLGLVKNISASSALKAALGAGAIVTESIAIDDEKDTLDQVARLRRLRPDMVLLAGGTDGGQTTGVVELAELLALAEPQPRFGDRFQLPVVYAGNRDVRDEIGQILSKTAKVIHTENVRPTVEAETLTFARDRIHSLFLEHVMQQAPGFSKLLALCDTDVMPTPSAVGKMLQLLGEKQGINALCVDIGGATTDVFSVMHGQFNRTVSANLGMSYSAAFVLKECGLENIMRWLPVEMDEGELLNQVMNKTVRPTTIPDTEEALMVEQALAREALRMSLAQHTAFAHDLKGAVTERNIDGGFSSGQAAKWRMANVNLLIGSGGVLSHAPSEMQTVAMLVDAFLPEGITVIAKDSVFMMPHLGVLSGMDENAALEVFFNDCVIPLVTSVAPTGRWKAGQSILSYRFVSESGQQWSGTLQWGELRMCRAPDRGVLTLTPVRHVDVGFGPGKPGTISIETSRLGILFDGRSRPLVNRDADLWQSFFEEWPNE